MNTNIRILELQHRRKIKFLKIFKKEVRYCKIVSENWILAIGIEIK